MAVDAERVASLGRRGTRRDAPPVPDERAETARLGAAAPAGDAVPARLSGRAGRRLLHLLLLDRRGLRPDAGLDAGNYREALSDEIYRTLFAQTIATAALAAAVTTVIAYAFAHAIRFHLRRHQEPLLFLVVVALFSGYLVRIYAWRTILGDQGVINSALLALGIVSEPLSFLLFSRVATTITLVNFLVPLAVLPIYAALQNVRDEEIEAARDLGASAAGAFWRVTLPLAWGGVFAAFALTFIIAAGRLRHATTRRRHQRRHGRPLDRQHLRHRLQLAAGRGAVLPHPGLCPGLLGVLRLASGRVVR